MTGLVIDAHGRARPDGSQMMMMMRMAGGRMTDHLDDPADGFVECGSIYLWPFYGALVVVFSPHLVTWRTVATAFFEIARQMPNRVDLICCGVGRQWRETLSPADRVFDRIDEIVREATTLLPRGLIAARLRLDVIDQVGSGRLSPIFEAWAQTGGAWTSELYGRMRDQNLLDRTVVARNPRGSTRLVIEHWGKKRDLFGAEWVRKARGSDVEAQPYPGLAAWVAEGMRQSIASAEPRLETVHTQNRTAKGRVRRRHYDRLLLPWTSADGDAFATTINIPRKRK